MWFVNNFYYRKPALEFNCCIHFFIYTVFNSFFISYIHYLFFIIIALYFIFKTSIFTWNCTVWSDLLSSVLPFVSGSDIPNTLLIAYWKLRQQRRLWPRTQFHPRTTEKGVFVKRITDYSWGTTVVLLLLLLRISRADTDQQQIRFFWFTKPALTLSTSIR